MPSDDQTCGAARHGGTGTGRGRTLARAKDLAVTAGAVVAVLAGVLAALDYMLEAKLDAKLQPLGTELTLIREELRRMDERYERRFVRLENLHLLPTPSETVPESGA